MAQTNFQKLVDKLIDGRDLSVNNFNGSYDSDKVNFPTDSESDKTNFSRRADILWEELLSHIHNGIYNRDQEKGNHYGVRENDFLKNKESLIEFINSRADLDNKLVKDGKLISFFDLYMNDREAGKHWNESVAELVDYYYNLFYLETYDDDKIDGSKTPYSNIKNADAGFSFHLAPFVKPDKNWDPIEGSEESDTYENVRAEDKILRVLKDMSHLQFTVDQHLNDEDQEKINQYLRLLMPEYQREVQIEDLDRNFWVIGQALTALFAFLFDDTAVYPELLSALLDEIIQLWENVFFLWLGMSIISEKEPYEDIKVLFLPVSNFLLSGDNDEIFIDRVKFDDFVSSDFSQITKLYVPKEDETEEATRIATIKMNTKKCLVEIWNKNLTYLKNKYDNCSLVIIPELREKNYVSNCYSKVAYPGIIFYDDSLKNPAHWVKFAPFERPIVINMEEQKLYYDDIQE